MSYTEMSSYNGWTNKPTWIINDWILNDQWLLEYFEQQAVDVIEHYEFHLQQGLPSACKHEYADIMKDYFEDLVYQQQDSMDSHHLFSFLNFAFAWVNWDELAESYLIDAKNNMEA